MPQKRKDLKIKGPNLWYLVGLITSDGCLSEDGRHVDITTAEREFLEALRDNLRLSSKIGIKNRERRKQAYRIQISNKNFYDFLLSVGLMPNKSSQLTKLAIPEKYFNDFLRGLIDGDGCIRSWTHPGNRKEQWSLRIYSDSPIFLRWLASAIEESLQVRGKIYRNYRSGNCYTLKFGKMASRWIVQQCYYPGGFALERKRLLAEECISSYIGWSRSNTTEHWQFN